VTRFDLAYLLALPALAPYLAWRRLARGKYTHSAAGMLGRRLPESPLPSPTLWLHAVSVGEVAAARAVAPGLTALLQELPLVISTITETGQSAAARAFPDAARTFFPVDISPVVRRFQRVYRPAVFVLMETELWPNFLSIARRAGTRCFMINGKLSDRSFPRYRRFRGFLSPALSALTGVCVQTEVDAERFKQLGIDPARVVVAGNCKFDLPTDPLTDQEKRALGRELGVDGRKRWIVAGSTHQGEEKLLFEALAQVRRTVPEAALLICPRHPERFDEVASLAAEFGRTAGWRIGRSSRADPAANDDIVVLDRMGVLAKAYGLGEIGLVGGSYLPVGGHNLLEAAAHRVPVVFGPRMHAQREIMRLMTEGSAGLQVPAERLAATLIELMRDEALRRRQADLAWQVVETNRGSAHRAVEAIGHWLGRTAPLDK
jgi:3-deoxy-D-manno-octulosonic-acid transferase